MAVAASSTGHLVHGMGTALEAPTWPPIAIGEAADIVARFPQAGRLVALGWHSPRPFSAAVLVETDRGAFFLKRHDGRLRSPAGLAEEHRFIAHLARSGLSVPQVMQARDGTGVVAADGSCYELHCRAPGLDLYRERRSWTAFVEPGHAHAAGAALARLHTAARDSQAPARAVQPLVASFSILPSDDPLAATEAYVTARPALAAFLAGRPWRHELGRLFAALGQGLPARLAGRPWLWTHNDWHPSNLLWTASGDVETIFDFGLADRTCALHDLATAIERSAIAWLDISDTADATIGDADAARAMLDGYRTLVPLDPAAIETMVALLPLVHIEFALSEIDYFAGVLGDRDQAEQAWDDYLIGHAEWFMTPPGRDFLARLANGAA